MTEGIWIKIYSDVDEAIKGVEQLSGEIEGMAGKFDPAFAAVTAGVAAITAAMVAVSGAASSFSADIEDAYAAIARGSGATGEILEGLNDTFDDLTGTVTQPFDQIAVAVADLNTRLGLTGPKLEDTARSFLNASRMLDEPLDGLIASTSRAMKDWGEDVEDATEILDRFFVLSQSTGVSMSRLGQAMVRYGSPLRQLGFSFNEAASMIAKFEAEGVNMELVLGSLRIALGNFARDGVKDTHGALLSLIDDIKNAGSVGEANALAIETFGSRAGPDMAAAIREGRFELDAYLGVLKGASGIIERTNEATLTLRERFSMIAGAGMAMLQPLGDELNVGLAHVQDLSEALIVWAEQTGIVEEAVRGFMDGIGAGLPSVEEFKNLLEDISVEEVRDWFEDMGESVNALFTAFQNLAEVVPWEFLVENLDTITYTLFTVWAVGKISALTNAIIGLGGAFVKLAKSAAKANLALSGKTGLAVALAYIAGSMAYGVATGEQSSGGVGGPNGSSMVGGLQAIQDELDKIPGLTDKARSAYVTMANRMYSSGCKVSEIVRAIENDLKAMENSIGDGMTEAKDCIEALDLALQEVEQQAKDTTEAVDEAMKPQEKAEITPSLSGQVYSDVVQSVQELVDFMAEATNQSRELVGTFGLSAGEAGEVLKGSIVAKADEMMDDLEEKFGNPLVRNVFITAMQDMARDGNHAVSRMFEEILDEMDRGTNEIEQKASALSDVFKPKTHYKKSTEGGVPKLEAYGSRKSPMDFSEAVSGRGFDSIMEEATRAINKVEQSIQNIGPKITEAVAGGLAGISDLLSVALEPIGNMGLDIGGRLLAGILGALGQGTTQLTSWGQTTGESIGANLEAGIVAGVDRAVEKAKAKLKSLKLPANGGSGSLGLTDSMRGDL